MQLILIFFVFGVFSIGIAQQVITTTTTTVITLPAKTTTTVISQAGTTEVKTIIQGGYRIVHIEMRPDQKCVVVIEGAPQSIMTVPGATVPGTTTRIVIPATSYKTAITRVEGGTTLTTTGMRMVELKTTISKGPVTTTIAIPVPLYGKIMEYCEAITVKIVDSFEVKEPVTLSITFPGFTFSGTTITMPTLLISGSTTVTETTTKPGTTYTTTIEEEGKTMVTTVTLPEVLETKTITLPGKTVTKTITYTTTLPESGTPTQSETTETSEPITTKTTATQAAGGIPIAFAAAIALILVAVVIAAILLAKRSRR